MRLSLWPKSLFGRLFAASIVALLLAQLASLVFVARERERFILQGSVREWSRRIAEVTSLLQGMDDTERQAAVARLSERPWRFGRRLRDVIIFRDGLFPAPDLDRGGPRDGPPFDIGPPLSGIGPPPRTREQLRSGAQPPADSTALPPQDAWPTGWGVGPAAGAAAPAPSGGAPAATGPKSADPLVGGP